MALDSIHRPASTVLAYGQLSQSFRSIITDILADLYVPVRRTTSGVFTLVEVGVGRPVELLLEAAASEGLESGGERATFTGAARGVGPVVVDVVLGWGARGVGDTRWPDGWVRCTGAGSCLLRRGTAGGRGRGGGTTGRAGLEVGTAGCCHGR